MTPNQLEELRKRLQIEVGTDRKTPEAARAEYKAARRLVAETTKLQEGSRPESALDKV